jgi:formyltetrahydrofolate-dependent phosphoribosylglycinamide formyltransferase
VIYIRDGSAINNVVTIGIFASGNGTNCRAIIEAIENGKLDAKVGLIISNNPEAGVLSFAEEKSIPHKILASEQFENKDEFHRQLINVLRHHGVELIVLAGYMKKIGLPLLQAFPDRILNIHPALLPAFGGKGMYGHHVHEAVLEYGAKITGVTVHLVDAEYDHGPIVMQKALDVVNSDTAETLAQRVLALEHETYCQAIQLFAENRVKIIGRKIVIN